MQTLAALEVERILHSVEVYPSLFGNQAGLSELLKANLPPLLTVPDAFGLASDTSTLPDATVGQAWSADLEAIDADGARFYWQLLQAPTGMSLQASTEVTREDDESDENAESGNSGDSSSAYHNRAQLTWTPTAYADAVTEILVRVQDSRGGMAYRTFQFNVAGGNSAPVIGAQPDLTLQEGQSLSLPILAADADGDRLTVTVKNLPPARASTPPRDFSPRPPATVNSHQIASIFESMPTLPTPSPSTHRHAVFLMILATLMWSIAGVVTRHLDVARGFEVTFWRSLFSAVALIVALRVTRGPAFLPGLMTARWPVWASSLSWATMFTAFMIALTLTTVANVLVTQAIGPLITAIFTRLFLRHRLPARTWAAIALGGVGIAWMFGHEATGGVSLTGSLIALFIPFAAASNWTLLQSTANARDGDGAPSSDMLPAILIGALISASITLPFAWPLQASLHDIALMALLGVFQLAIPCLLVVRVSRELPAAEIALLGLLEVLFGVAWAWLGASEQPSLATLTGGSLVIAALILNEVLALRQKRKVLAGP